jgi:hypothetical protein
MASYRTMMGEKNISKVDDTASWIIHFMVSKKVVGEYSMGTK